MEIKSVINLDNMPYYLKRISEKQPERVIGNLKKGDLVKRGEKSWYRIDNPHVYTGLKGYGENSVPYKVIYRRLREISQDQQKSENSSTWPDTTKLLKIFKKDIIHFSEAYEKRLNHSLEKAILFHLMMQDKNECFIINGKLGLDDRVSSDLFYNLIFRQEVPYVIDLQNRSLESNEIGILRPYMNIPIAICGDEFLFSSKTDFPRSYSF